MGTTPVSTNIPSILQVEQTNLRYLLNLIKDEVKTEINCHAIGTIQTFDPVTQTCSVQFNYQKVLKKASSTAPNPTSYVDIIIPYTMLIRVPVIVLGGGGSYLTFPISVGDTCIVMFVDRDIDLWLELGGTQNPPNTERLHDLSDGVALVGLSAVTKAILNYFTGGITMDSSWTQTSGNFTAGNGFDGTFATGDGRVATVSGGIIISVQ